MIREIVQYRVAVDVARRPSRINVRRAEALRARVYDAVYTYCTLVDGEYVLSALSGSAARLMERVTKVVDEADAFNAEDLGVSVAVNLKIVVVNTQVTVATKRSAA